MLAEAMLSRVVVSASEPELLTLCRDPQNDSRSGSDRS